MVISTQLLLTILDVIRGEAVIDQLEDISLQVMSIVHDLVATENNIELYNCHGFVGAVLARLGVQEFAGVEDEIYVNQTYSEAIIREDHSESIDLSDLKEPKAGFVYTVHALDQNENSPVHSAILVNLGTNHPTVVQRGYASKNIDFMREVKNYQIIKAEKNGDIASMMLYEKLLAGVSSSISLISLEKAFQIYFLTNASIKIYPWKLPN
jgi:hypothetical protein